MSTAKDIIAAVSPSLGDRFNVWIDLNQALRLIAKRLRYHMSALVQGDLSEDALAGDEYVIMPDDFWGLIAAPNISTLNYTLEPLPNRQMKLEYKSPGQPRWYELVGKKLILTPSTASDITINGTYFVKPPNISKPSDEIPYNELFDDAIQYALVMKHSSRSEIPAAMQIFTQQLNDSVDEIIPFIERQAPARIPQNSDINYQTNTDYNYGR